MAVVSGHLKLVKRKRGDQWYMRYRPPSGKQQQKRIGPAWNERSKPPAGFFTRRTAQAVLDALLTDLRRGEIPDPGASSGKTSGDAIAEWLRYVEHEKARRPSTIRDYRNAANGQFLPEFGADTPLEKITEEQIDAYRQQLLSEGKLSRRTIQKHMVFCTASSTGPRPPSGFGRIPLRTSSASTSSSRVNSTCYLPSRWRRLPVRPLACNEPR